MGYTSTGLRVNVVRAASYADSGHARAFTQPGRGETTRLSIPCRLAVRETGQVLEVIAGLREQNVSVIIVSHNMQQLMTVADRITVMYADNASRLRDTRKGRERGFDSFVPSAAVSIGLTLGATG